VHVSAKIYVTSTIPERCGFERKGTYLLPPRKKQEFAGISGEVVSTRLGKNARTYYLPATTLNNQRVIDNRETGTINIMKNNYSALC